MAHDGIAHLSVFAFAPQPLLIELGGLLSDISAVEVYQRHREPTTWKWQTHSETFAYNTIPATECAKDVALNLSLSGTITNDRISAALKQQHSIWTFTIDTPDNDFLRSREQLRLFRTEFRKVLDRIKARHGDNAIIHVFPAVPVSVAVEIGRVWMPKADLPLKIYEQNRKLGGFVPVCELGAHART